MVRIEHNHREPKIDHFQYLTPQEMRLWVCLRQSTYNLACWSNNQKRLPLDIAAQQPPVILQTPSLRPRTATCSSSILRNPNSGVRLRFVRESTGRDQRKPGLERPQRKSVSACTYCAGQMYAYCSCSPTRVRLKRGGVNGCGVEGGRVDVGENWAKLGGRRRREKVGEGGFRGEWRE
ncbi:histidine kinase [Striga asiatica]|uniref:Histidine kinase n=1 Tax=Striga asiatica TaxID=4170 RepID=A0A5A7PQK5_STRAF|nr:histidine kinase [Striga asiatica]